VCARVYPRRARYGVPELHAADVAGEELVGGKSGPVVLLPVLDVGRTVAVTLAALLAGEGLVVAGLTRVLEDGVALEEPTRGEAREADAAAAREAGETRGEARTRQEGGGAVAGPEARPARWLQAQGQRDLRAETLDGEGRGLEPLEGCSPAAPILTQAVRSSWAASGRKAHISLSIYHAFPSGCPSLVASRKEKLTPTRRGWGLVVGGLDVVLGRGRGAAATRGPPLPTISHCSRLKPALVLCKLLRAFFLFSVI
jgi:hypothetical protein